MEAEEAEGYSTAKTPKAPRRSNKTCCVRGTTGNERIASPSHVLERSSAGTAARLAGRACAYSTFADIVAR